MGVSSHIIGPGSGSFGVVEFLSSQTAASFLVSVLGPAFCMRAGPCLFGRHGEAGDGLKISELECRGPTLQNGHPILDIHSTWTCSQYLCERVPLHQQLPLLLYHRVESCLDDAYVTFVWCRGSGRRIVSHKCEVAIMVPFACLLTWVSYHVIIIHIIIFIIVGLSGQSICWSGFAKIELTVFKPYFLERLGDHRGFRGLGDLGD